MGLMDNAVWGRLGVMGSGAIGVGNISTSDAGVEAQTGKQPGLFSPSHPWGACMILGAVSAGLLIALYISLPD
jgi:hypothetical protein